MNSIDRALEVLDIEIEALRSVRKLLGDSFAEAVDLILHARKNGGKVVITGMGKSLHIGQKIAATLTSTGTPAATLHPSEAMHGDLGILGGNDVLVALSYSGATEEIVNLIPIARRQGARVIAMTGVVDSPLAELADAILPVTVPREACPFNMAPTASTTAMLAVGDALAMVLLQEQGFMKEDYAKLHPGGAIGRALLLRVRDIMRTGDRLAIVPTGSRVKDAVIAMTRGKSGAVAIVDDAHHLLGIFTDGDLRRHLSSSDRITEELIDDLMTRDPLTLRDDDLAVSILNIFEEHNIDDLVVLDAGNIVVGQVDIQDLPKFKIL